MCLNRVGGYSIKQGSEVTFLPVFLSQQALSTLRPGAVLYLPFIVCCLAPASKHCAWYVTAAQYVSVTGTNIYLISLPAGLHQLMGAWLCIFCLFLQTESNPAELLPRSEEYAQGSACLFEVCVCACVCTHIHMHTGLHVMSTFSVTGDLPLTAHVNRCPILLILGFAEGWLWQTRC